MARSKLVAVSPKAAEPSKPKILIFGKPGVGKTYNSLDFPNCYFIDTEGGANLRHYSERLEKSGGVYMGPAQGSNDFEVVLEQLQALATEDHPYRTLVIDSVSHLFGTEVAIEQAKMAAEKKKDEYGASRRGATSYMRRIVTWLDKMDLNVILIAHQRDEYGMLGGKREVIGVTFDCWDKLEYILHLALHITKQGPSRRASVRKTRLLEFPEGDNFPWSYDEFADRYGRHIIEGDVRKLVLASDEQTAELTRLLSIVKMPDDWEDKVFKKANVDSWADMNAEDVDKCLALLRNRLTPVGAAA